MSTIVAHRKSPSELSDKTAERLAAQKRKALEKIAAGKRALAAVEAVEERLARQAQHTEELRLGRLAYAAGLAGAEAGWLEKEFAASAGRRPVVEEEV